jgi:hypothetical protein
MNIYLSKKVSSTPKVHKIKGHPGCYTAQITGDPENALHFTKQELTALFSCLISQVETLEREPVVVSS